MARRRHDLERLRSAVPTLQTQAGNPTLSDFQALRLVRVREQLEKLDRMIADEEDPQKLDRLASAQSKLSEQERIIDGRPLPGSRRPKEDRTRGSGGWIELQPALPATTAPAAPVAPAPTRPEVACLDCLVTAPARPLGWEYDDPNAAPTAPDKLPGDVTP